MDNSVVNYKAIHRNSIDDLKKTTTAGARIRHTREHTHTKFDLVSCLSLGLEKIPILMVFKTRKPRELSKQRTMA